MSRPRNSSCLYDRPCLQGGLCLALTYPLPPIIPAWEDRRKTSWYFYPPSFPWSTSKALLFCFDTQQQHCPVPGPGTGIPQCRPLRRLEGSRRVLSLNAHSPVLQGYLAPPQGSRTRGKALIEKGRSRERPGGRKRITERGSQTQEKKVESWSKYKGTFFVSLFLARWNTNTRK